MTRVAPAKVRKEAKLGLDLHKKWKRGGTAVGVARAVQLSSGKAVSDATIKRMYSYFQRHQHDRLDKDGSDGSIPGRGYIAWLLWGGWSGRKWAEAEYKKLQGKKKNPISKPVKKIKEDLSQKQIYLIKVTLDDYRSEPWAHEMVTKEEDFEVVDNYDDNGEPIFKMSEFVYSILPKHYLTDFNFTRQMITEGKIERMSFPAACRAWLENDQPLDWFNEQAHDRGYITKDEYLFLVKVNNPTKEEEVEDLKEYFIELAKECGKRPKQNSPLGIKLMNYLSIDPEFKNKIKSLCPDWFRTSSRTRKETLELMDIIREMARRGDKRPSPKSKDPEEKKLGNAITSIFTSYPDFRDEILSINRDWFLREERKWFAEYKEENPYKMQNPARNVANVEDVRKFSEAALEKFIDDLNHYDDIPEMNKWFKSNFFKGIMNSERTEKFFPKLTKENLTKYYEQISDVPEFVIKAVNEGKEILFFDLALADDRLAFFPIAGTSRPQFNMAHFVDFYDSDNFPDNPSRVSYDQMIDLVLRWDEKNKKKQIKGLVENDEKIFIEYPNGIKWVQLFSRKALENEGAKMGGICIGSSSSHVEPIKKGDHLAFSLRDKHNTSYVTVEYIVNDVGYGDANTVREIKGYHNKGINEIIIEKTGNQKYVKDLFLKLPNHDIEESFNSDNEDFLPQNIELLYLNNKIMTFEDFGESTEEIEVRGNLDLTGAPIKSLPKRLKVEGKLSLGATPITSLPEGLKVEGNLDLSYTKITSLPEGLEVGGSLYLTSTPIKSLPKGLKVEDYLDLGFTPITSLPEGLNVGGNLDLSYTEIKSLPEGLIVRGDLVLHNTPIESLPERLIVGGDLDLKNSSIRSLPEGLKVEGNLDLSYTKITSLPEGLEVGGSLYLTSTPIKSLPEGLNVGENLYLTNTPITSLPERLIVGGDLDLKNSSIRSLPEGLIVGGDLVLRNTPIESLPGDLQLKGRIIGFYKKENPLQLIARGYDERPISAYDREELKLGIKTELEHTDDAIIASKIAKDHLDEDPHYYSKLVEMERGMKKSNPSNDDKITSALRYATIDYVILSALKGTKFAGLPPFIILEEVKKIIPHENEKSLNVSIAARLKFYLENGYIFKRSVPLDYFKENFKKGSSSSLGNNVYAIDTKGIELLDKLNELFSSLGTSIKELQKQKNPSKDGTMTPEEYLPIIEEYKSKNSEPSGEEQKTSNPVSPESEEYLSVVEDSIAGETNGLTAWIDESTGDILVGWMAFEEDRSFDDVMVRIKPSGRILEGESVDDSIRASAHKLMKKIHKDLASYVTLKKSNPVPAGVSAKEFDSLVKKLKKRKDVDNPYALANWILKQKNPTAYEKLVKQLAAKGVDDPKALAAWIGRQKYGKEEFQRRAAAGKRKKKNPSNNLESLKKDFDKILEGKENE